MNHRAELVPLLESIMQTRTKADWLAALEAAGVKEIPINLEEVVGRVAAHDVVDAKTGEILVECNQEITTDRLERLRASIRRAGSVSSRA